MTTNELLFSIFGNEKSYEDLSEDEVRILNTCKNIINSQSNYIKDIVSSKSSPVQLVLEERLKQIIVKGWTYRHDMLHKDGELGAASAAYALPPNNIHNRFSVWPFERESFKPSPNNRKRELVKSCALGLAEISRLIKVEQENN